MPEFEEFEGLENDLEEFEDEVEDEDQEDEDDDEEFEGEEEIVEELATELLEIEDEDELDEFIGGLLAAAKGLGAKLLPMAKSLVGKALPHVFSLFGGRRRKRRRPRRRSFRRGGYRGYRGYRGYGRRGYGRVMPWRYGRYGYGRPRYEMEMDEEMEFEAAASVVRMLTSADRAIAEGRYPGKDGPRRALKAAARKHLLVPPSSAGNKVLKMKSSGSKRGTWYRKGDSIVLKGIY